MHKTVLILPLLAVVITAHALEYRSTIGPAQLLVLPSDHGNPVAVVSAGYPLEVVFEQTGWVKVRDATGAMTWVEGKNLSKTVLTVLVRVDEILVRDKPDFAAAVVFRAAKDVLLDRASVAVAATAPAGWLPVKDKSGRLGWVRINEVWGG